MHVEVTEPPHVSFEWRTLNPRFILPNPSPPSSLQAPATQRPATDVGGPQYPGSRAIFLLASLRYSAHPPPERANRPTVSVQPVLLHTAMLS